MIAEYMLNEITSRACADAFVMALYTDGKLFHLN